ncbi:hypothetical protein B0T22DRAFT_191066 [Podospora appendiculata]|uniref:F-box domain-containing protein n=1 Tax=Podospora appendiculata TaxID=314037 RepID=A0AAE1CE63_9PEZI|nr:hypothetical protein B0T22DRAFT_191066 [Podospora appendiculata]
MNIQSLFCGICNGLRPRRQRTKRNLQRAIVPRKPRPIDPTRPSLVTLPDDILWLIVELLQDTSPGSVTRLASVCSSPHATARRIQHRVVCINSMAADDDDTRDRLAHMARCGLLPAVHTLKILAPARRRPDDESDDVSLLVDLLPAMKSLRDIKWDISLRNSSVFNHFPLEVINHTHPTVAPSRTHRSRRRQPPFPNLATASLTLTSNSKHRRPTDPSRRPPAQSNQLPEPRLAPRQNHLRPRPRLPGYIPGAAPSPALVSQPPRAVSRLRLPAQRLCQSRPGARNRLPGPWPAQG